MEKTGVKNKGWRQGNGGNGLADNFAFFIFLFYLKHAVISPPLNLASGRGGCHCCNGCSEQKRQWWERGERRKGQRDRIE